MGAVLTRATAVALLLLLLGLSNTAPLRADEHAGTTDRLRQLYDAWQARYDESGGDESVRVALRWAKGISVVDPPAGGSAVLNLRTGAVVVEVNGLEREADVWLIDNRAGIVGADAMPDAGDEARLLGTLHPERGSARLAVELGPQHFARFDLDRIVVCLRGDGPREGIVVMGGPSAFQRMHWAVERGRLPEGYSMDEWMQDLVAQGQQLFEEETFEGNGRTCATCHPSSNNFTIDPRFIATLPDDDPLFVAERVPELAELENPLLMRTRGLILENLDGFDRPGVMRGVPHTLALGTSLRGPEVPFDNTANPDFGIAPPAERTGWSGDGSPGSGTLREFAIGAVIQHFPLTLARESGEDFRLPTDEELDALELFQLSLGRSEDADLGRLDFRSPVVRKGFEIFVRADSVNGTQPAGKCGLCHDQAGANINSPFFSNILGVQVSGNANFGTGVNDLAARPEELIDPDGVPPDGGFARVAHDGVNCQPPRGGFGTVTPPGGALPPGLCEEDFNTPSLVEAADTGPFFHNNAVDTIEAAVAFYNNAAFNESPGGQLLARLDTGGVGILLDTTEVTAVASFLRVVNALENIRESISLAQSARAEWRRAARKLLARALEEERDAIEVLEGVGLHPEAVAKLRDAKRQTKSARRALFSFTRRHRIRHAIEALQAARELLAVERS